MRAFSQNFLADRNIIKKILRFADVQKDECILEIGPGKGALTAELCKLSSNVYAIEKDPSLIPFLRSSFPNLHLYEGDILEFPLEKVLQKKTKVIANIPYHITTEILLRLVHLRTFLSRAYIMVQKEVADKLTTACPATFSQALIRTFSDIKELFFVPRGCFQPRPNVDSAVIELTFKEIPGLEERSYEDFLRTLYQNKKRQLLSLLSTHYPKEKVLEALQSLHIDPKDRPFTLTVKELISLFEKINR
ncbi:MAG TPA: 16S rRNA (adenine(1518)-N(6)/adenine(1519)-N(6))-dimethyltransferase RsmA [Chlamydiales bacterium]|nr:16S rRNA (adenine(1518)-N(6)/adenine(1519)-N(6))-dimethyltransferase RsmA [Chlamydiales bacterium]